MLWYHSIDIDENSENFGIDCLFQTFQLCTFKFDLFFSNFDGSEKLSISYDILNMGRK